MKNQKSTLLLIIYCLSTCIVTAQPHVETIKNTFLNPKSNKVLVVAHRGNWRSAPENSTAAIDSAIAMKVDIVEIDIQKTKDGQLILMHDNTLDRTTTGKGEIKNWTLADIKKLKLKDKDGKVTNYVVPTLEEALLTAKGKIMVNLDKAYDIFDDVYAILEKTETQNLVIMKGGQPIETVKREFGSYLDKVLYMPVIDLGNKEAEKIITDYLKELRPAAFEIIYSDPKNPLPPKIKQFLFKKSLIWYNTLWGSLAGNHDDNLALTDPEKSYGYLIEQLGARILQTDQPAYLLDYLRKKGWHN